VPRSFLLPITRTLQDRNQDRANGTITPRPPIGTKTGGHKSLQTAKEH
jgi:hypothetical protein